MNINSLLGTDMTNKCLSNLKFLLLALLIASTALPQNINLPEAIELTLKNNSKIKEYEEKLAQKEYQDMEAFGNFLPSINLAGSYNHLDDPLIIDLSPIRDAIIQIQSKNQVEFANTYNLMSTGQQLPDASRLALYNGYSAALDAAIPEFKQTLKKQDYKSAAFTVVQPVFTGGKLWAYKKLTSAEEDAAQADLRQIKNDRISETVQNYLIVVLLKDVIKTREEVLYGVTKHRDRAKRLLEEGLIANYNLLRAEVAVADAENNLSNDRNNLEVAMIALKNTMGVGENSTVTISDSLVFAGFSESQEVINSTAVENNPVLKLISYKKEAAAEKFNIERSAFLPSVAAFGKYELYPEYLSALEPRWVVGIQASFNLFNGLKDYSKMQAASHLEDEVSFLQKDTESKISLLVSKSYKDVLNASERYFKTNKIIDLARENLRLNDKRFETGLGTSLEVIDAHLSYEKASVDNKTAIYEYYRSLVNLYNAAGEPEKMLSVWNRRSL
jgi:outer membrane protein TolC